MTVQNWDLEFLNHNELRSYPLAMDATKYDITGSFLLPNDFIVGAYLATHAGADVDPGRFTIKSVVNYTAGFNVVIGYYNGSIIVPVAATLIPHDGHQRYDAYRLNGIGDFNDISGFLVIGQLDNISEQPPGLWNFDLAGGRLDLDAIRPFIRAVTGLRVRNGNDLSGLITGDIILSAGTNFRITPVIVDDEDPVIVFDAIEGEGLNEVCVCDGDLAVAPCIRTINKRPPTADGDFHLAGSECVVISPIQYGLLIEDTCCKPCCGPDELLTVTQQAQLLDREAATMESILTNLEAQVSQMSQSLLGSRLGDTNCDSAVG